MMRYKRSDRMERETTDVSESDSGERRETEEKAREGNWLMYGNMHLAVRVFLLCLYGITHSIGCIRVSRYFLFWGGDSI